MNNTNNKEASSVGGGSGGGPCGACKFLRRKCVKGCVFAPYFEAEQGTAHFAAVHKVFGASNASKLLLRLPPQKRLDAVLTLSYEALARLRDPVYGCVAHIFTLQQQVVNLQAEVAYVQARLSTLQRSTAALVLPRPLISNSSPTGIGGQTSDLTSSLQSNVLMHFDHPLNPQASSETTSFYSPLDLEYGDLQALGRQLVSQRSAAGQRFRSSDFN